MTDIPREYWGKANGEEWFIHGTEEALAGKPMLTETEFTSSAWGNRSSKKFWKAYRAGYEAQQAQMETGKMSEIISSNEQYLRQKRLK
jgi:hypothetical protein